MRASLLALACRQPALYAAAILCGLGGGLLIVGQAGLVSLVVGQVFLEGDDLSQVSDLMAVLVLVIGLRAGLAWLSSFSARQAAVRLVSELRQRLLSHLFALGPLALRKEQTGELVNTLTAGMDALQVYFGQYLPQVALAALVPLAFLVFIFPLDTLSGLILLLTAPLIPVFMFLIGKQGERLTRRQWNALSQMSAFFLDILQGLETLKMLGRSQAQAASIAQVNDRYRLVTFKVMRVTFLSALALELVATLSTAVVAVEVGLRLLFGRLEFEQAFFVLLLAPDFYLPLRSLGARFHAGMAGVTAAGRIFELLEQVKDEGGRMKDEDQPSSFNLQPSSLILPPSLSFRNISFSYGPGRQALHGVSFELPAGKTVALVGPSGAGKSTLADLLLRFSAPDEGEILVNGIPLPSIPAGEWRSRLAWVAQSARLFYGTVEENIRLGKPQAGREQVVQAAMQAHAHQFIQSFPRGYQTMLGERGVRLSAGQAQRIALARAFLLDAPLILLDEATANLDPGTDDLLQESIHRLLRGRTGLLIAHRLGTALKADHVVVLDNGRVVEQSSPHDLLERGGVLAGMVAEKKLAHPRSLLPRMGHAWHGPPPSPLPREGTGAGKHQDAHPAGEERVFTRLLALLQPYWGLVGLSVLLGTLTVLSGVGLLAVSAYLISYAALAPSIAELQVAVVGVRFFGITRGLFRYLERLVSHDLTLRLLGSLRLQFYRQLEPLAPARLQRYRSGDLLQRIGADINHLEGFYVRAIAPVLEACLVGLVVGGFFSRYSLDFTLAWWIVMAVGGIGLPLFMRLAGRGPGKGQVLARAALQATLVESLQGMPDLVAFGAQDRQVKKALGQAERLDRMQLHMSSLESWQAALSGLVAQSGMWLILFLGIQQVAAGELPGVLLASLALAAAASFEALAPLPQAAQVLEGDLAAGQRLFEIVAAPPETPASQDLLPLPDSLDVEVQSLGFAYPPEFEPGQAVNRPGAPPGWELRGIAFSLPAGKKLAVVGASGCGKTSLARLLLGFWQPTLGGVYLAGQPLQRYDQQEWRRQVAVVPQDPYLFNASLRDNLLLTRPAATSGQVETALEMAQLLEWAKSLPQGLDTPLGEFGMQLSGGERQRAAIARALLQDASILILDEPTANLDIHTERRVLETILSAAADRSLVLITHRLVGLDRMDEILVLSDGEIVERGTLDELLAYPGHFRRMWEIQQGQLFYPPA
jgi:ATP-binding cassette subfamily C protein CydCD